MTDNSRKHYVTNNQKGVSAILIVIMITMFFGFAALAIDIGYGFVTKNQLQNVADAAALAAARWLGCKYAGNSDDTCPLTWTPMTYQAQQSYDATVDASTIISVAQNVANQSTVAEQKSGSASQFTIKDGEVIIGRWDPDRTPDHFTPTFGCTVLPCCADPINHPENCPPNAVRVIARRDSSANGPITTFLAKVVFGIDSMNVSARATAALTGESTAEPGGLTPVGISCSWAQSAACGDAITFYPTTTSCAGWNTYTSWPANASKLREILDGGSSHSSPNLLNCATYGLDDPSCYLSPETIAESTQFVFTGGTLASAFPDMEALFNAMKILNDGYLDKDNNLSTWTTAVPIYAELDGSCPACGSGGSNPTGNKLIVGFATIVMTEVVGVSEKELHGQLICDNAQSGRGSGHQYGTLGSIPGLVE